MRDRLIELAKSSLFRHIDKSCKLAENIADDLLAEGVIVPPVKIGQSCYRVWQREIIELKVVSISYEPLPAFSYLVSFDKIGKLCLMQDGSKNEKYSWDDVFLTREEAERALERSEG